MRYEKVIVLGTGSLALKCAELVKGKKIPCILFDMNEEASKMMESTAQGKALDYVYCSRKEVKERLRQVKENTVLVSAINPVILPKDILEKENIKAINCHQALLPRHPGRNAEAWAIYNRDQKSGITWHTMEPEVDAGKIIIQKEVELDDTITSFRLFQRQLKDAYEAFAEIIDPVMLDMEQAREQDLTKKEPLHYSWQIPNEGNLNLEWPEEQISAFLRAMDYKVLEVLGRPRVSVEENVYTIVKYKIVPLMDYAERMSIVLDGDMLVLRKKHLEFCLKIKQV